MLRLNVSPVRLVADGFVRTVADSIDEFGIEAGSVFLVITERVVVSDIEKHPANSRQPEGSGSPDGHR